MICLLFGSNWAIIAPTHTSKTGESLVAGQLQKTGLKSQLTLFNIKLMYYNADIGHSVVLPEIYLSMVLLPEKGCCLQHTYFIDMR